MGARQPEIIADVAWGARGRDLGPANGVRVYCGPAWPGVAQLEAWGVPWQAGYEGTTTRAYAGYDAGRTDAAESLIARLRAEKPDYLEKRCSVWFCAADEPSTPAWALPGITEYGRGFGDECHAQGFFPATIDPYGNRDAILAARAGLGASNLWGVGTWGNGEGFGPDQMPGDSDCAVLQSGNTPGPVPGDTDFNAVYVPFAELHMYGGPTPTPPPKPKELPEMFIGVKRFDPLTGECEAFWVDGGVTIRDFGRDNPKPWGPYGLTLPQAAFDFAASVEGIHVEILNDLEWLLIDARTKHTTGLPNT